VAKNFFRYGSLLFILSGLFWVVIMAWRGWGMYASYQLSQVPEKNCRGPIITSSAALVCGSRLASPLLFTDHVTLAASTAEIPKYPFEINERVRSNIPVKFRKKVAADFAHEIETVTLDDGTFLVLTDLLPIGNIQRRTILRRAAELIRHHKKNVALIVKFEEGVTSPFDILSKSPNLSYTEVGRVRVLSVIPDTISALYKAEYLLYGRLEGEDIEYGFYEPRK
jgi:hypothetical protein